MAAAVAPVSNFSTIMVGGFGGAGTPVALREAVAARKLRGLSIIANNADFGAFVFPGGLERLTCSFPVGDTAGPVLAGIEDERIELRLTPQGTLAEMIRAGGAGLGGVLTPTGLGMEYTEGYRQIEHDGRSWLLAPALRADVALVKGAFADTYGNVVCRSAGINFNPSMAMAADYTIVQADEVLPAGEIRPEDVTIPSVLIDAVVHVERTGEG